MRRPAASFAVLLLLLAFLLCGSAAHVKAVPAVSLADAGPGSSLPFSSSSSSSPSLSNGSDAERACVLSFASFDAQYALLPFRTLAHRCPAACTLSSAGDALVYGSFPYHGNSSICRAAVHSGLIHDALGGAVFVSRFYRHDWSATASIFPHGSSYASLSSGVQSQAVAAAWPHEPATASDWSYTVRGRGDFIGQRRMAPFSPRSDHLHATYPPRQTLSSDTFNLLESHIIIGGYNGTHYLNDVWMSFRPLPAVRPDADIEWRQLEPAPFQPRADMAWTLVQLSDSSVRLYVVGGQTGHLCELLELGVCSDEVWVAEVQTTVIDIPGLSLAQRRAMVKLSWLLAAAEDGGATGRLPFAPRCGAALLHFRDVFALVGGQLSASSCQQVNRSVAEVWNHSVSRAKNASHWWPGPSAPFGGRRSMQRDDTFTLPSLELATQLQFDRVAVTGGVEHLSVSFHADSNRSTLLRSVLHADVWTGSLFWNEDSATNSTVPVICCNWTLTQTDGRACPASSIPVPAALGASGSHRSAFPMMGIRFGGADSVAAIQAWQSTPPIDDDDPLALLPPAPVNITAMSRVNPDLTQLSCASIDEGRRQLPRSRLVEEKELNDVNGSFVQGSSWVQSHSPWRVLVVDAGSTSAATIVRTGLAHSTLHYQHASISLDVGDASWAVPQSASCLNSTRPRFRFPLGRLGHKMTGWTTAVDIRRLLLFQRGAADPAALVFNFTFGQTIVSGGRRGAHYLNDWLSMTETRCLPPDDPSFLAALGAVRIRVLNDEETADLQFNSYVQSALVHVVCAPNFHFEPASESTVSLFCAPNGLWIDDRLLTIRRCVEDRLNCTAPGEEREGVCAPPIPVIHSIQVDGTRSENGGLGISNLPLSPATLTIVGRYFAGTPVVLVGGHQCEDVVLLGVDREHPFAFNLTLASTAGGGAAAAASVLYSETYGSVIECTVPVVFGFNLPITVVSGVLSLRAQGVNGTIPVVSSTPPRLDALIGNDPTDACRWSPHDPLRLDQCHGTSRFSIYVCATTDSFRSETSLSVWLASDPLHCTDFSFTLATLNFTSNLPDVPASACASCVITPRVGSPLPVRLRHAGQLTMESAENATLSFRPCDAGYRTNSFLSPNDSNSSLCIPCPAGFTSQQGAVADTCELCAPGKYSNVSGSATCSACEPGTFVNETGATGCRRCPVNSFQQRSASDFCHVCDANQYLVVQQPLAWAVSGTCRPCPSLADCSADGLVRAKAGSFLLVDQTAGTVESATCSSSACWTADRCSSPDETESIQQMEATELSVINCCADGRRPAYDPLDSTLASTSGINVLCAKCLDGFSVVNGDCIVCPAVNVGSLSSLLLLSAVLVYLVHRLPHDWTGSAIFVITSYFVQQSALLLTALPLPPQLMILSLFNMNLLGGHGASRDASVGLYTGSGSVSKTVATAAVPCTVPLSDMGRLQAALMSPLLAFLLLLFLAGLQLILRRALTAVHSGSVPQSRWLRRARWMYCTLFATSPPGSQALLTGRLSSSAPLLDPQQQQRQQRVGALQRLRESDRDMSLSYMLTCVRLLLLSYSLLSLVCLQFFLKRPVGAFGERLAEYPDVNPASDEYRRTLPVIICLLIALVAGLPLSLFCLVLQHHSRHRTQTAETAAASWTEEFTATWQDDASSPSPSSSPLSRARAAVLLQLCSMFTASCWWMSPFILVRRLLLVLMLVVTPRWAMWTSLTLVNFVLLSVHLRLQPFARRVDNQLESITLGSLALQTVLFSLSPVPLTTAAAVLLSVLFAVPLLAILSVFILERWRAVKQRSSLLHLTDRQRALAVSISHDLELDNGIDPTPLLLAPGVSQSFIGDETDDGNQLGSSRYLPMGASDEEKSRSPGTAKRDGKHRLIGSGTQAATSLIA